MSRLKIASSNSLSIKTTGQTASMKSAVYLQTSNIPNAPLAVEHGYFGDTKHYQKRICLRPYLLGYKYKNLPKCCFARPDPELHMPPSFIVRSGNELLIRGIFIQNGRAQKAFAPTSLFNRAGSAITQSETGVTVAADSTADVVEVIPRFALQKSQWKCSQRIFRLTGETK